MQQRLLGPNGPSVGAVGLGCMSLGGAYGPTTEAECYNTLDAALDLGVTLLDTANIYGNGQSETIIGSYLARKPHRFTLASKAGIVSGNPRRYDNSEAYLRSCLEASLKRLQVEHIDLFYIHRREASRPIEEVMEYLVAFKNEGKIGAIGLSEVAPSTLERACAVHPVAAVQNEYSLSTRLPELGLLQACQRTGTTLVAFSPLGRGILADGMADPSTFANDDFRKTSPRFIEPNYSYNTERIARFSAYAASLGHSAATLAVAWVLQRSPQIIAIPGTRFAHHLQQDAAAADLVLSAQQMAEIEQILPVGFAHGDRYADDKMIGPERYC